MNDDRRYAKPSFCPQCGYDMRASNNRCPECGWLIPKRRPVSVGRIPPRPGEVKSGIIANGDAPKRRAPAQRLVNYHPYTWIAPKASGDLTLKVVLVVLGILMWSCCICGSMFESKQ